MINRKDIRAYLRAGGVYLMTDKYENIGWMRYPIQEIHDNIEFRINLN